MQGSSRLRWFSGATKPQHANGGRAWSQTQVAEAKLRGDGQVTSSRQTLTVSLSSGKLYAAVVKAPRGAGAQGGKIALQQRLMARGQVVG